MEKETQRRISEIEGKYFLFMHFAGFPRGIESIEFQNWFSRPLVKY